MPRLHTRGAPNNLPHSAVRLSSAKARRIKKAAVICTARRSARRKLRQHARRSNGPLRLLSFQMKFTKPGMRGNPARAPNARANGRAEALATRQASQQAIAGIAAALPELLGGSADLTDSNLTQW